MAILPFVYPAAGISFVGQIVLRSPASYTFANGVVTGQVTTRVFQLDRARPEISFGTTTEVGMRLSIAGRRLDARWRTGGAPWSAWTEIIAW